MRNLFYYSLLTMSIVACNNEQTNTATTKDTVVNNIDTTNTQSQAAPFGELTGCYMRILGRDTLVAKLEQSENKVTGKLTFDNFQKDGSSGIVSGHVAADTIKLIYSFRSEGMNSVMEVYFKKDPDGIIRGIGDMDVKGDTAYYKKPSSLQYPEKEKWIKISCEQIPAKYQ